MMPRRKMGSHSLSHWVSICTNTLSLFFQKRQPVKSQHNLKGQFSVCINSRAIFSRFHSCSTHCSNEISRWWTRTLNELPHRTQCLSASPALLGNLRSFHNSQGVSGTAPKQYTTLTRGKHCIRLSLIFPCDTSFCHRTRLDLLVTTSHAELGRSFPCKNPPELLCSGLPFRPLYFNHSAAGSIQFKHVELSLKAQTGHCLAVFVEQILI